jgi:hypothetical protein
MSISAASGRAASGRADATAVALAATVRLRIDDERGHSYGTGTIIDVHKDEALVVTCGHIFRDSQGNGQIAVDLFDPRVGEPVPGTMVGYDLDRDVGLVSIRPPIEVTPVPIADADCQLRAGQTVFSAGCDRGGQPSTMEGRINCVNRYCGPPNLSVSGLPVDGRSGGGLFTTDGVLIGVCNAADPQDHEGLYAAAGSIHAELDRAGLGFVYRRNGAKVAQAPPPGAHDGRGADRGQTAPMPTSPTSPPPGVNPPHPSVLGGDHEVICIVRSRSNPRATSQVFVVEQPTGEFLDRLAREAGGDVRLAGQTGHLDPPPRISPPGPPAPRTATGPPARPIVRGQTR